MCYIENNLGVYRKQSRVSEQGLYVGCRNASVAGGTQRSMRGAPGGGHHKCPINPCNMLFVPVHAVWNDNGLVVSESGNGGAPDDSTRQ